MSKNKKILLIAFILVIVGLGTAIIGFAQGGFSNASSSIIIGTNDGIKVLKNEEKVKENKELEKFNSIEINSKIENIEIVESDKYAIEMEYYKEFADIDYKVENRKLIIEDSNKNFEIYLSVMRFESMSSIKIYVPKDINLEDIVVNTKHSDIDISGIKAKRYSLDTEYGNIVLKNVEGDDINLNSKHCDYDINNIKTKKLTINNDYGQADIKKCITEDINIETTHVGINIEGELRGKTKINSKYGDIVIDTNIESKEYNSKISVKYGNIEFDDEKYEKNLEKENSNSKNRLDIDSTHGDVMVQF